MGQAECKKCSPGTYVSVDRQPGSKASDCHACPYGERKQRPQSINPHNQWDCIVRKPRRAIDHFCVVSFLCFFLCPIASSFSSLFVLFFCHFDVIFFHPLMLYFHLVFVSGLI